jgi:hypothetical protein
VRLVKDVVESPTKIPPLVVALKPVPPLAIVKSLVRVRPVAEIAPVKVAPDKAA